MICKDCLTQYEGNWGEAECPHCGRPVCPECGGVEVYDNDISYEEALKLHAEEVAEKLSEEPW